MPQTLKETTLVHLKKGKKNNVAQKQKKKIIIIIHTLKLELQRG